MARGESHLDAQPEVHRRTILRARLASFGSGLGLVAIFLAAWASDSFAWHMAWLGWYIVVSIVITYYASIPRKQQRELDRQWAECFRERSLRDELTGLHNRRYFNEALERAVTRGPGVPFALVLVDVNDFKRINDTYGHGCGDTALRHMARLLLECAPAGATVARIGGDEFAVILPTFESGPPERFKQELMDRLRASPLGVDGTSMRIYAAAGHATWRPGMIPEDILREADLALYGRKAEFGRAHNRRAS